MARKGKRDEKFRSKESDKSKTPDDDEGEEDDDDDEDGDDRTFSQSDVTRISAREKREGRRTVLKELGFKSIEEAKAALAKLGAEDDFDDDDDEDGDTSANDKNREEDRREKRRRDRDSQKERERQRKLEERERALERRELEVALKDSLREAGAKNPGRALKLLDVEPGADDEDIEDAIQDLREEMPELFSGTDETDEDDDPQSGKKARSKIGTGGADSNPGSRPKKAKPADPTERALARLHRNHPELANKK